MSGENSSGSYLLLLLTACFTSFTTFSLNTLEKVGESSRRLEKVG